MVYVIISLRCWLLVTGYWFLSTINKQPVTSNQQLIYPNFRAINITKKTVNLK